MSLCVITNSTNQLVISSTVPCQGTLLLESADVVSAFGAKEALSLVGACASLYALVYIFKLARRSMGI